jgi:hypothetical protein
MTGRILCFVLLFCSLAYPGTVHDLKISCARANAKKGASNRLYWMEQCAEQVFTLDVVHPTIKTIAPGTGVALGLGSQHIWRRNSLEYLPSLTVVGSFDGSVAVRGDFTIALPPLSFERAPAAPNDSHLGTKPKLRLVVDSINIDRKASINLHGYWLKAQQQDFYGLGPLTSRSGLALYGLSQAGAGVSFNDPITTWGDLGFSLDLIRPRLFSVLNAGHPSIEQVYTAATAPGLGIQSEFVRYEPYLHSRFRVVGSSRWKFVDLRVGYAFYQDLDGNRFSFRRLAATAHTEYDMLLPSRGTASHRSPWKEFLCPTNRGARHCSAGTLDLMGHASAAFTGVNSIVPFYFDETLGGSDIYGTDTLRGYADYRFRGPSRMLFQAEYRHGIWGPIGFLGFYDVGRVASRPSDLAFEHLRHDFGLGVTISATNRVVFRVYMGFGTGEGIRPNAKFGSIL